jgi:CheY-like chemotaxis protein
MAVNELISEIDHSKLKDKKILLADDLALNQFLAKHILESWGCKVTTANNGKEVLDLFQHHSFDCILMDVQMPELDGLAATQLIRQLPDSQKASVPIIALTSNLLRGDREKYISTGMNDCIGKPFEEANLFETIYKNISGKEISAIPANTEYAKVGNDVPISDKVYDLKMVISVSGGDQGFIKKMVLLFMETVPENLRELRLHIENANWNDAAKVAHKLKSTIDSMGIKSIHQDIRSIEANAKQATNLGNMKFLLEKIETVITQCIHQLKAEFE